jgi:hypothetical protein
LGYRNIQFSPVTFDGQSFRGAGLELNPGKLRFAGFYGKLNRKVNEDTTSGQFMVPRFSRIGYGAKIGVGTSANYFDLIYFHAKDDSSSSKVINNLGFRKWLPMDEPLYENWLVGRGMEHDNARWLLEKFCERAVSG